MNCRGQLSYFNKLEDSLLLVYNVASMGSQIPAFPHNGALIFSGHYGLEESCSACRLTTVGEDRTSFL
jgi:hypothetical protein